MLKQLTLSTLAFAALPFVAPSTNAMTFSEAKREICDAAREYVRWGTTRQATEEVEFYAQDMASSYGFGTNGRLTLERIGKDCVYRAY